MMNLSELERIKLAKNVRNRRIICNLNREELAYFSCIDHSDIEKIENGEFVPDEKTIERIYFILGMPLKVNSRG